MRGRFSPRRKDAKERKDKIKDKENTFLAEIAEDAKKRRKKIPT